MTTETATTSSAASQAEAKRRGSRSLRPKLSVERESPKKKITFELRESTETLLAGYAQFLSEHYGFEVAASATLERIVLAFVADDELFQEHLKEAAKRERAGAKAKAQA